MINSRSTANSGLQHAGLFTADSCAIISANQNEDPTVGAEVVAEASDWLVVEVAEEEYRHRHRHCGSLPEQMALVQQQVADFASSVDVECF